MIMVSIIITTTTTTTISSMFIRFDITTMNVLIIIVINIIM